MIALISDVHGNLEALTEVLAHIRSQPDIEWIGGLGDIVGYGPNPAECLDLVRDLEFNLMGNHEEAVLKSSYGFNRIARLAIEWTREQLRPRWRSSRERKQRWEFMKGFLRTYQRGNVFFVHGSPRDPTMEYILRTDVEDSFGDLPTKVKEIFSMISGPCFVGHTHYPGIITEACDFLIPSELPDGVFRLKPGEKAIINVGSVGQPRDQNPSSCYITFDGESVHYHRVPYDIEVTIRKIEAISELPDRNGTRLRYGA